MANSSLLSNAPSAGPSAHHGLFRSFWMAGYEGADHLNSAGCPLSMNEANQHWQQLDTDYALLERFGIRTVRESIGWRVTEQQGNAGFERLRRHAELAEKHGIEVIWSLMHYGWPADIDLLSPAFVERFTAFSEKVARTLRGVSSGRRFYQPINEISFLAWALSSTGLMQHARRTLFNGDGPAVKMQLVRAALRACEAIGGVDPDARFMHSDPMIHVASPSGAPPEAVDAARRHSASVFEAWDMLCGRAEPQLGGSPRHLDIVGINYYHDNQWANQGQGAEPLHWHLGDPLRKPLGELLDSVWQRYRAPVLMAETSHVGEGRGQWLDDVAREVSLCRARGTPLEGICLYPAIDRHGWDDFSHWHHSGLWDVQAPRPDSAQALSSRILCQPYAEQLWRWQRHLPGGPRPSAEVSSTCKSIHLRGIDMPTIIVFSHLRWNFVYQRPQHLLSRLAKNYQIIFMEEPVPNGADFIEHLTPAPNVEVLRPHVTSNIAGFHDDHLPVLQSHLADFIQERGIDDYLVWFYTPMALPLASGLAPRAIVYDCMDELSAFMHAPRQLIQRENALYQVADLVLTGGPSLYRSKRERHGNVHCFSSSVDAAHFAPAAPGEMGDHPAQAGLPHPRLGYCGVIDERVDLELIAAMADVHPEWQIVMVGPVVKISPDKLPQRSNIHWLGQQSYEDLPRFMAGWDVCLLPFALNDSTRFISPTKTLEYMAAGRPSVSTRIRDVDEPYGHVVEIADTALEFINACEALLAESDAQAQSRLARMQAVVSATSWDATADAIHAQIDMLPARRAVTRGEAANVEFPSTHGGLKVQPGKPAAALQTLPAHY
jgi:UDP-galactopyranose mutase